MSPIDRIQAAIERVRELDEKATRGPWTWDDWSVDGGPNKFTLQAPPAARPDGPSKMFPALHAHILTDEDREVGENDKAIIAESRTLLPRMAKALEFAVSLLGQGLDDIDRRDRELELADILDGEER